MLDAKAMKAKFRTTIFNGMKNTFGSPNMPASSEDSWQKIAEVISNIAIDIVEEITSKAEVPAGIPVTTEGEPATTPAGGESVEPKSTKQAGKTTAPGKIK